jgi:hypothetical protein
MIRTIDFSRSLISARPFMLSLISPAVGRFSLSFHFNLRAVADLRRPQPGEGAWFFALSDSLGTPLLRSVRVVVSTDLLARHHGAAGVPPGVLRCEGVADPGLRCLGEGRCKLVYEES